MGAARLVGQRRLEVHADQDDKNQRKFIVKRCLPSTKSVSVNG